MIQYKPFHALYSSYEHTDIHPFVNFYATLLYPTWRVSLNMIFTAKVRIV